MSEIIVTKKAVLSTVAKWAVQQSPYPRPDNLEVVLDKLNDLIKNEFGDFICRFQHDTGLRDYLHDRLIQIPEYWLWNDRKNGNDAPMQFVSRYSTDENPDDDFIDLDALEMNVVRDLVNESIEIHGVNPEADAQGTDMVKNSPEASNG
jgi:hypothetical protein